MSNIIIVGFGYFVSEFGPFDCFFLSVHNHSCMLPNSVVIHDIFMQFYMIMNLDRMMCQAQE